MGIEEIGLNLAKKIQGVIAITGKRDLIISEKEAVYLDNGDFMLTKVTGTGCMTSTLIGCAVGSGNVFWGAVAGVCFMGIAGEIAKEKLQVGEGLGSYRVRLLDAISNLDRTSVEKYIKIV